jgi:hypothetical protein
MLDRLHEVLDRIQYLPQSEQEEVVEQIERLLARIERRRPKAQEHSTTWHKLIGVWANDNVDQAYAELDRIRHANPPSPPLQLP